MTIAVVDWALRAADQLDYMIRLWVIPFPTEANWSIATTPLPVVLTALGEFLERADDKDADDHRQTEEREGNSDQSASCRTARAPTVNAKVHERKVTTLIFYEHYQQRHAARTRR
jgi:hypothetical protein